MGAVQFGSDNPTHISQRGCLALRQSQQICPCRIEGIAMMVSQTGGEHHKNGNGILKRSH